MSNTFKTHKPLERVEIYAEPALECHNPLQVVELEVARPGLRLAELLPGLGHHVSMKRFWAVLRRTNDRLMVQRLANGALRACP